jgi:hypothetical protein
MAQDRKYGRVWTENGEIGELEPVVVFRATDVTLPKLLAYYHLFCVKAGSPREHLDLIMDVHDDVIAWQAINKDKVKVPDPIAAQ